MLSGNIWDYFIVFWAGVLVSFTPCLYPLLPVTAGIIGGINTQGSRRRGFVLSVVYVSGIAVTYCTLAAVAAWQGQVFGKFQNNPYVYLLVGNVLVAFALILLDIIPFPVFASDLQAHVRPRSLVTLFLFGLVSGLVVGPCTAPVLGTLLFYVASRQNILHAVSLLLFFSYGVGASLILVGTFSGLLARLPKSGIWLVRVKQICAIILLVMAEILFVRAGGLF